MIMNILFISQWYPNRYDKMAGLFVQKHAKAASLYCKIKVLYVHADENINTFEIIEETHENLTEIQVYYPNKRNSIFRKFIKPINYFRAYIKGYKQITSTGFLPDIVHVNILSRTGFMAYLFKRWKNTPYIVTEHWTRYLPIRDAYKGLIRHIITKQVVRNAAAILPVSVNLKNAMLEQKLYNRNYIVVNNVVDDFFFENAPTQSRSKKRMIHISCFDERAKNIKGIIRATHTLSKIRQDVELVIIGTGQDFDEIYAYNQTFQFPKEMVHFLGEKTPEEVAYWIQNSDFLVHFSNYENAPVVISESLAAGKPVISTNVGGISEYINDSNGILIKAGDETALTENMNFLLDHLANYNPKNMKTSAQHKFSYHSVGKEIYTIYKAALKKEHYA
jgi:glycosyltransferase involved in cell wall biosynthesis